MAYNFRQNWVFRGGFTVNTLDLWTNGLRENFDEYLATAVIQQPTGNPAIAFKLSQGPPPVNFNVRPDGSVPFIGTNYAGRTASYCDPAMRSPYVMNWNAGIQRQLGRNYLLEINYQGSAGVGLLNRWDINAIPLDISKDPVQLERIRQSAQNFKPYPQFGSVMLYSNFGHSSFHSGTVKVEKRMSVGIYLHVVLHLGQVDRRSQRRRHRRRDNLLQPAARKRAVELRCRAPLGHLCDLGSAVRQGQRFLATATRW